MTREEAIKEWIIPALKNTWNEKKNAEILKALEQEPCEDTISRQAALGCCRNEWEEEVEMRLKSLPSVTPKQKIGRWIAIENEEMEVVGYYCSECDLPMERSGGQIFALTVEQRCRR